MIDAATILLRTRALLPIIEHRRAAMDSGVLCVDNLADLIRAGVTGMVMPKKLGGPGLTIPQSLPVISALAEVCPATAQVAVETNLGLPTAVLRFGSRDLCEGWAASLLNGRRPVDLGTARAETSKLPEASVTTGAPAFAAFEVPGGRRAFATCGSGSRGWIALTGEARAVKSAMDLRRLGAAAIALGVAERAVGGLRERTGGSTDGDLGRMLGAMTSEIAAARGHLARAAQGAGVARAKMLTVATAGRIVDVAGQVFERIGYSGAATLDHLAADLRAIDHSTATAHVPANSGVSAA